MPVVDLGYELHQAISYNEADGYYNFSNVCCRDYRADYDITKILIKMIDPFRGFASWRSEIQGASASRTRRQE